MAINDSLGDRIKKYESVSKNFLTRRTPVIIRLDGKAFHTFCKNFTKPYDDKLIQLMSETTEYLVDNIQGAVFGYTQSDEISILLRDYDTINTCGWFDYNIQKIVSVASSLATGFFNANSGAVLQRGSLPLAFFDCRAFNVPKEDVCNAFIWRQNDATRNSIQSFGQHYIGHKKCQNLNNTQVQDKLMELDPPINWNDAKTSWKRGVCYTKNGLDLDPPIFTQDRKYIEQHVYLTGDLHE